ncbi:TPA: phosphoribosylaminoimidazolesuccinocarboxamide synthase [bacterium]|nr:phosphoribosylaminoimidazolesuccinocarboxamide synthase [bacterium]
MGSTKDTIVIKEATEDKVGVARFYFSNRYSVFDWGEMPDLIQKKGTAICILSSYFFEKLEEMGIFTHYLGIVEDGVAKRLSELKFPSNIMEIRLLSVIKPEIKNGNYDYSLYREIKGCFLIPLEIIYRNYLGPSSSIFKRLKEGELTIDEIGLDEMPIPGQRLDTPILDVSTKLEASDRYISWEEAKKMCSLKDEEIKNMKDITQRINRLITEKFTKIGLTNEDGKFEFGFDENRCLILVDAIGTLDECRFTYNDIPVSKEIARMYYRNTKWYEATEVAKKKDIKNWKEICLLKPQPLPEGLVKLISNVYCACTNEITEKEWFSDIPPLEDILKGLRDFV